MNFLKLPKMNIGKIRESYYTPESIVHPAKMDISLANWILDMYVKDGDIVLDPMCGIGTTLAEGMRKYPGSVFIGVELEKKFCDLAKSNIAKTTMYAGDDLFHPKMATAVVIQGDARSLPLQNADAIVTSPSYGGAEIIVDGELNNWQNKGGRARTAEETFKSEGNLGRMKYGKVDAIVSSPPYSESEIGHFTESNIGEKQHKTINELHIPKYSGDKENIGNLKHGQIDKIVTSPPYAEMLTRKPCEKDADNEAMQIGGKLFNYNPQNPENIDKAPYDTGDKTYLTEMLKVYAECNAVLKMGGLMILVTKNFVRNGEQVRLDEDTIRLCEVCGFELIARHYRELRKPSFWRIRYKKWWEETHPGEPCPNPLWEDILVFRKGNKDAVPF